MPSKKQIKKKLESVSDEELQRANQEAEAKIDQEMASRTATYDQDLKERARKYSINPDNFATQKELGEAIKIYEELNDIQSEQEDE